MKLDGRRTPKNIREDEYLGVASLLGRLLQGTKIEELIEHPRIEINRGKCRIFSVNTSEIKPLH